MEGVLNMSLKRILLRESTSFEIHDWEKEAILFSPDGFNSREDAEDYLEELLKSHYPAGYKNIPNQIWIYRVMFIEDISLMDSKHLGAHWTIDPNNMGDINYVDTIRLTTDPIGEPWVLISKISSKDIDQFATLHNNILYPHEEEITLKDNVRHIETYIVRQKNFNVSNPLNSNILIKVK